MEDMAESSSSPRPQANKPGLLSSRFTLTLRSYVPKSRRTRRLGYVLVGVVIILLWIGMILAFARFESKAERTNVEADAQKYRGRGNSSGDEIVSSTACDCATSRSFFRSGSCKAHCASWTANLGR